MAGYRTVEELSEDVEFCLVDTRCECRSRNGWIDIGGQVMTACIFGYRLSSMQ